MKLSDLAGLAAPPLCQLCRRPLSRGEAVLCAPCLMSLAGARFPLSPSSPLLERLPRLACLGIAGAMLSYRHESPAGRLLRAGKYAGRPDILRFLARMWAQEIARSGTAGDIDALQPVPMHLLKRMRRGYNQAEIIAGEIAAVTGIPVVRALRAGRHPSQTRRDSDSRHSNVAGIYRCTDPAAVAGRHIALVDDIITSGATLGEAAAALVAAGAARVSILPLAATAL